MQTKLATLRSQLGSLRQKRAAVRWGSALCTPLAVALWLLVAAFLCDWSFNLPMGLRAVSLLAWIAGGIWTVQRFAWPLVKVRESEQDVALIVEQHHKIDSDLVAAIQFETPHAENWGSSRLQQAVVDYVAEFSPSLNVYEGFSYRPLPQRATVLGITLVMVLGAALAFPGHAIAFWNRFLLGSAHYPTKTQIQSITVNGQPVPVFHTGETPRVRVPYGQRIEVAVKCGGEVPRAGFVQLSGVKTDAVNRVDLNATTPEAATFAGEITHVADSFRMRFHFGDAVSDPAEVVIVPLPLVDLAWEIEPPKYAASAMKPGETDGGSRQLAVIEGSVAKLKLVCSNKPLKSATLTVGGVSRELRVERQEPDKAKSVSSSGSRPSSLDSWTLPAGTPFDSIREPLKYEVQVVDEDGFSLETPISGQIRLKPDRLPRVVATAVTRFVLPTALPKLDYAAGDDFGVTKIVAVIHISREDGRTSQHEVVSKTVALADQPQTILRGQVAVPLSPYELMKGDEVKVTLEVTDWRGELPGQKGLGEPITFSVTDLNGILAQTGDEDKKTAKQLDEILRRELGIGGEKK
ncbi:MAG: hypothetical protein H7062_11380 [Candidatus Saccharimonas sp.]|nr:hypothetical protein [Planctomycetaceae bacterium]